MYNGPILGAWRKHVTLKRLPLSKSDVLITNEPVERTGSFFVFLEKRVTVCGARLHILLTSKCFSRKIDYAFTKLTNGILLKWF